MADDLDVLLLAELRSARVDFEDGKGGRRSRTSVELSRLTGVSETLVRTHLRSLAGAALVFEDRVRERWTAVEQSGG
jgi:hypothetical protein